jgi:hypothetical protein
MLLIPKCRSKTCATLDRMKCYRARRRRAGGGPERYRPQRSSKPCARPVLGARGGARAASSSEDNASQTNRTSPRPPNHPRRSIGGPLGRVGRGRAVRRGAAHRKARPASSGPAAIAIVELEVVLASNSQSAPGTHGPRTRPSRHALRRAAGGTRPGRLLDRGNDASRATCLACVRCGSRAIPGRWRSRHSGAPDSGRRVASEGGDSPEPPEVVFSEVGETHLSSGDDASRQRRPATGHRPPGRAYFATR